MLASHKLESLETVKRLAIAGIGKRDWYDRAFQEISLVSKIEQWDRVDFTNTLAILSPRVTVVRNIRAALAWMGQGVHFKTTMATIRKSLSNYHETGIVGGNKVSYFARALQGDRYSITLDSWMSQALLQDKSLGIKAFQRKETHKQADRLVTKVGDQLGLTPRDCQAAIWCGIYQQTGREAPYYNVVEQWELWEAYDRAFPTTGSIGLLESDQVTAVDWIDQVLAESEPEFL